MAIRTHFAIACLAFGCICSPRSGATSPAAAVEPVHQLEQNDQDDLLIADFESESYGDWKAEGQAFGRAPAKGTLPNQMPVTGFLGKGLVNSYLFGDDSTGRLTSLPFAIRRRYINFLIGGGKFPGETCINLVVDGKVVRSATGPNDQAGGSEQLEWHSWDVGELAGRSATLEIIDSRKGGWGHINVDHIVQSDRKRQANLQRRELFAERRYLHLPVKTGASKRQLRLIDDGRTVREFEIELADAGEPDFWAFLDLREFAGRRIAVEAMLPGDSKSLDAITQDDEIRGSGKNAVQVYDESARPQFHFTSRRGWLNDPNGLVYYKGEYHLFYQHNPYGWNWGNMHWGHAVSRDLMHWEELPIALYPQRFGDWCFSGSAAVDPYNTLMVERGDDDVLVAAYTSTGRGEAIATSVDRGRTWTEFSGNPVVRHQGRDPKIFWHEPTKRWVMAVYDERGEQRDIAFYSSTDLKQWTFHSRIAGFFECPDLFELPIRERTARPPSSNGGNSIPKTDSPSKWVLYAADGQYVLGHFDGTQFLPESGKQQLWFGNFYAAQTYNDAPDQRRIQIGWGRDITFPGMPFNQQMTIPVELTLRTTDDGVRMFAEPVRELAVLHGRRHTIQDRTVESGMRVGTGLNGDLFDIRVEFEVSREAQQQSFGLSIRGIDVTYDVGEQVVRCRDVVAPLKLINHRVQLQILVDRGSIEVFGNSGRIAISAAASFPGSDAAVRLFTDRGSVRVRSFEAFELKSAWKKSDP
jgi:fructan beta-fructosidase